VLHFNKNNVTQFLSREARFMQTETIQELSDDEIPLFPLNVVLFPGGVLPLHIFEHRYRTMIQFCLKYNRPFGVVLIKSGREVGEYAEPYGVGTTAKIIDVNKLEDGRMNLIAIGQRRFEIIGTRQDLPYLVGRVRIFDASKEKPPDNIETLVLRASQLYRTYELSLAKLIPVWEAASRVPTDPHQLAYQIGVRLQKPLTDKQQLLETLPIDRLLRREIELLEKENQRLKTTLVARSSLAKQGADESTMRDKILLN
jgi:Lon protease-like protein